MFHSSWSVEDYLYQLGLLDAKLIIVPSSEYSLSKVCDNSVMKAILDSEIPVVYLHHTSKGNNVEDIVKQTPKSQWTESVTIKPKDGAAVSMTSGSTGKPKGVLVSHVGIIHCGPRLQSMSRAEPGDKLCYALLSGDKNCTYIITNCALLGITLVIPHFKYSTSKYLQALSVHKCSTLMAPPFVIIDLLNLKAKVGPEVDVSHLKSISSHGNMLKESTTRKTFECFTALETLTDAYGCTETGLVSSVGLTKDHVGHVGQLIENVDVKVVDDEGQVVPIGHVGRIMVKTEKRMIGYYKGSYVDSSTIGEDGFYDTGDKGSFDKDGNLYLKGRTKEIINIGGLKVYPIAIESLIDQHGDVLSSHVMAVDDERLHNLIGAWVYVKHTSDMSEDSLRDFLRKKTKDTKNTMPEAIFISKEAPPQLAGGKLDGPRMRRTLQQLKDATNNNMSIPAL
ncbi:4-coumarate--CoA ligase-like 2 [Halotydeus destructor]|nr:4-coumarate--CoA ligase-like 2 [Halotydeus destructor]